MLVDTRVNTLSVDTRAVIRTVVIASTADYQTSIIGISSVTALAATFWAAGNCETLCIRSARIFYDTRIQAMAVDTGLTRFAFRISFTSNYSDNRNVLLLDGFCTILRTYILIKYLFCKQSLDFHHNLPNKNILDDGFEQNIGRLFHNCKGYGTVGLDMPHLMDSRHS